MLLLHNIVNLLFNFQELIESSVAWNDDIGEWQLQCVAYTGNNMRRRQSPTGGPSSSANGRGREERSCSLDGGDLSSSYLSYGEGSLTSSSGRPRTARGKAAASGSRPKSSRPKSRR